MAKIQMEDEICSLFYVCEEYGKRSRLYDGCKDPGKNKPGYCSKNYDESLDADRVRVVD